MIENVDYQFLLPGILQDWKSPIRYRDPASTELKIARERADQIYTPVLSLRLVKEKQLDGVKRIHSPADAYQIAKPYYDGLAQEHLCVMPLNTKNQVIAFVPVYVGSVHTTVVRIGELFTVALKCNASGLILMHNHPSGDPTPSPEDAAMTREIVKAGQLLDVEVIDHLTIGDGRFVSLKERGLGF